MVYLFSVFNLGLNYWWVVSLRVVWRGGFVGRKGIFDFEDGERVFWRK